MYHHNASRIILMAPQYAFQSQSDTLKEFIAFEGGYKSVSLLGSVANQDLHSF